MNQVSRKIVNINEKTIYSYASDLNKIKRNIAKLIVEKEEIEIKIKQELDHKKEGSKSYDVRDITITVTSPMYYKVDKEKYLNCIDKIDKRCNPVLEKIEYKVDKDIYAKVCAGAVEYSLEDELIMLNSFIKKKPGKLKVELKDRIK